LTGWGFALTILNVQHISKAFGVDEVLKDVSLMLTRGERIGLVGVNGSGKTTLLRILIGELNHDGGIVSLARDTKVGYLSQVFHPAHGNTVLMEAEETLGELNSIERRLRDLERVMGESGSQTMLEDLLKEYSRLTERFEQGGGYAAHSQLLGVLTGLGFQPEQLQQQADTLSGGELTRLGMAKLLLQKPDLLLLDEPTNHLDMQMLSWLETYLKEYRGALLVISHDRYFLDAVCTGVAELISGTLEIYQGNYSSYIKQREERFQSYKKAYQLQQKEIARQKAIIARFRSFNREKSIRAAESREKALERIEQLDRPHEEKEIAFHFEVKRHLGDYALRTRNLKKSYAGKALFTGLDLQIRGNDRVALIGPNGIGKTNLLRCLTGRETPDEGSVEYAPKADMGYYDQRQLDLDPEKDVLNEVWDAFPLLPQSRIRGALGLFLFSGDDVFTPIRLLSGGERSRVSLAKLLLRRDNLLVLDEPTNHLDADSREALEKALEGYEGAILAVSHDRYFINRFANRILLMDGQGITSYDGNYDDYLSEVQRMGESAAVEEKTKTELARERKAARQLEEAEAGLARAVIELEEAIRQKESQLCEARERQALPEVYADPARAAEQAKQCRLLEQETEELFHAWAKAEQELADFR